MTICVTGLSTGFCKQRRSIRSSIQFSAKECPSCVYAHSYPRTCVTTTACHPFDCVLICTQGNPAEDRLSKQHRGIFVVFLQVLTGIHFEAKGNKFWWTVAIPTTQTPWLSNMHIAHILSWINLSMAKHVHQDTADVSQSSDDGDLVHESHARDTQQDRSYIHIRRKVDVRLCSIAAVICSLNLLDSGILSSGAVTSMLNDLGFAGHSQRFSVAIFIFTVASICAQLPATILMRMVGPPIFFSCSTCLFGLITLCTAFISSWKAMIALRVLLGISMSGIYPGLTLLISVSQSMQRYSFSNLGLVLVSEIWSTSSICFSAIGTGYHSCNWQYCQLWSQSS